MAATVTLRHAAPYWRLRPLKPGREAYGLPGWTPLGS
jgi:hypothetical protein